MHLLLAQQQQRRPLLLCTVIRHICIRHRHTPLSQHENYNIFMAFNYIVMNAHMIQALFINLPKHNRTVLCSAYRVRPSKRFRCITLVITWEKHIVCIGMFLFFRYFWTLKIKCCLCIMDHGHNKVNNNKICKIVIVKIKNEMKIILLIW